MAPIVGLAALAVVVIVPLWTASAVLGAILNWLVRRSDRAGAVAQAPDSSAAARSVLAKTVSSNVGIDDHDRIARIHPVAVLREG
jgi:hypothetical protein